MLNNILNLDGVTVLGKKQLESVNGGQTCKFTLNGSSGPLVVYIDGFSEGSTGSSEANGACGGVVGNSGITSCHYDCAYDGFGQ